MAVMQKHVWLKAKHHRETPRQAVERYRAEWNQDEKNKGNHLQHVGWERLDKQHMLHTLYTVEVY